MARGRIVLFKCEGCGGEFAATQGGLCRSRGRLLCRRHLVIPLRKRIRLRDALPPLCKTCQQKNVNR